MKTYPYTSIKLIDGKINVFCNVEKKPNDESMFYKRRSESQNWGDYLLQQWKQNHEVFEFANQNEIDKVFYYLTKKLGFKEYEKQLINSIEVNCIEIKSFFDDNNVGHSLAYFKEETTNENNQTKLAGEIISIVKNHKGSGNALFTLLTKYQITRK